MSGSVVHYATEDEINDGIADILRDIGMTYEELKMQAEVGRFTSGKARQAWFILASLGEPE